MVTTAGPNRRAPRQAPPAAAAARAAAAPPRPRSTLSSPEDRPRAGPRGGAGPHVPVARQVLAAARRPRPTARPEVLVPPRGRRIAGPAPAASRELLSRPSSGTYGK